MSNIILCLSDSIIAKTREILEDYYKSSNEVWHKVKRMCSNSSQKAIHTLKDRFNTTQFY